MNWLAEDGSIIVCGVVSLVILFNIGLIYAFMNPAARRYIQEMRGGIGPAQSPWKREAASLQELRDAVEKLDRSHQPEDE
jgi:hypothetical protein